MENKIYDFEEIYCNKKVDGIIFRTNQKILYDKYKNILHCNHL